MPTKTLKRSTRRVKLDPRIAAKHWLHADDAVKQFGKDKEDRRQELLAILEESGTRDEAGHYWINWPDDPVEGRIKGIKAERRVSRTLDIEAAEEYLTARKLYNQCTQTIVALDEDKILGLNFTGKISDADLESLYVVSETYAFVPQRVKL
jgi:hypothetical protein